MTTTPKPPSGGLSGPEGTMMRRGSGGRLGVNHDMNGGEFDPTVTDRRNESSLDDLMS